MIGGIVIETLVLEDRVWVNVQDYNKTEDRLLRDTCAVYVEKSPEARSISDGDMVWWQGGFIHWTAKDRYHRTIGKPDVKIKRLGFSGVERPVIPARPEEAATTQTP
jgi:hypothetical protein